MSAFSRPLPRFALAFVFGAFLLSGGAVLAQKPDAASGKPQWTAADQRPGAPGQSKKEKGAAEEKTDRPQDGGPAGIGFFRDNHREAVTGYFAPRMAAGKCPPGLAKKNNGCLPPGIAKKWAMGQPLPSGVTPNSLPEELRRRLGLPPAGHEYGRVDDDVVLLEIATRKVVDAIFGLSGR